MERAETNFYEGKVLGPTNSRKENNYISIKKKKLNNQIKKPKNQKEMF
jgi:hypothetical protein